VLTFVFPDSSRHMGLAWECHFAACPLTLRVGAGLEWGVNAAARDGHSAFSGSPALAVFWGRSLCEQPGCFYSGPSSGSHSLGQSERLSTKVMDAGLPSCAECLRRQARCSSCLELARAEA